MLLLSSVNFSPSLICRTCWNWPLYFWSMDVVVVLRLAVCWALNDKLEKGLADETSGAVKSSRLAKRGSRSSKPPSSTLFCKCRTVETRFHELSVDEEALCTLNNCVKDEENIFWGFFFGLGWWKMRGSFARSAFLQLACHPKASWTQKMSTLSWIQLSPDVLKESLNILETMISWWLLTILYLRLIIDATGDDNLVIYAQESNPYSRWARQPLINLFVFRVLEFFESWYDAIRICKGFLKPQWT